MPAVWIPKRLVEYSLINVASENTERFVQRCETQYENRIFQAAGAVLESGRKIVMLTGPSASGKTTTAVIAPGDEIDKVRQVFVITEWSNTVPEQ